MREIKFRAWDKKNKKMLTVAAFYPNTQQIEDNSRNEFDKQEYTLQQFTGLLDKNGKEIYEGDIVKYTNHSDELNILIEEVKTKRFVNGFMPFNYTLDMDYTTLEVIGNIFEHKHLLDNTDTKV